VVAVRKCSTEVFKGLVGFVTAFCLVNINLKLWANLIFKHDVFVLWKKHWCYLSELDMVCGSTVGYFSELHPNM